MKALLHHIERIKGRPHHVRHQTALGSAAVLTAFIAFVWLTASFSSGSFAVNQTQFAAPEADAGSGQIAGAAGALAGEDEEEAARIEIVDAKVGTTPWWETEQTTIPF